MLDNKHKQQYNIHLHTLNRSLQMAKFTVRTIVAIELEVEADTADQAENVARDKIYTISGPAMFDFYEEVEVYNEQGEAA